MTTKPKAQAAEPAAEPARTETEAPRCGTPHHLAMLAHLACAKDAGHDEREGADQAERRHEVRQGGTLYVWE